MNIEPEFFGLLVFIFVFVFGAGNLLKQLWEAEEESFQAIDEHNAKLRLMKADEAYKALMEKHGSLSLMKADEAYKALREKHGLTK